MEMRAQGQSYPADADGDATCCDISCSNAGQAVSRGAILENVWGLHESTDTRAIDNFIVRLRRYIEDRPRRRDSC